MTLEPTSAASAIAARQAYQAQGSAGGIRPAQPQQAFTLDAARTAAGSDDVITPDERRFFQDLFPASSTELGDHHAYARDGSRVTAATGTVVDRKG